MKKLITTAALLLGVVASTGFGLELVSSNLVKAHENYLKADYAGAVQNLRQLLMDEKSSDLERTNAFQLLNKMYQANRGGDIPVDWHIPSEMKKLKLSVRRRLGPNDGVMYGFHLTGVLKQEKSLKQIQLVEYPNNVIIDKEKGLGYFEEGTGDEGPEFYYRNEKTKQAPKEGLYLINIEMTNGNKVNGWVIVNDMISTDNPRVRVPSQGEVFMTGNPSFHWYDFRSPEYKPHEYRSVSALVIKPSENGGIDQELWEVWQGDPIKTETTVGTDPEGKGVSKLEKGKYIFYVNYGEKRKFGDMYLNRDSSTIVPFYVK